MTKIKTRIRVAPDGALSGQACDLPVGEYEAEIVVPDVNRRKRRVGGEELLARIRAIQADVAQLPVLDARSPDEIIGYNEHGHFD